MAAAIAEPVGQGGSPGIAPFTGGPPICDCGVIRKAIDTVKQRTRAMSERVEDCGGFGR